MSTNGTDDPSEGGKLIAAEYVLGVLGAEERRELERRLAQEPVLASEVAFWEQRLTGLADTVAPVPPPPTAWSRIAAAIGTPAAAVSRPASAVAQSGTIWRSLAFWRSFGIASATLAAASIAALAYIGLVVPARPPLMATLGGAGGQPSFVAAVTSTGNRLVLVPAALLTNDPRAMELWLIPSREGRPRSLGLVQRGRPIAIDIPRDLADSVTPDATLAISLEPPGGSPTGLPTGPVIASGKLANL